MAFAHAVRVEVDRRKRRLGILSYDDLLGRLAEALDGDDAPARERMRQRWKIVLVDEFQDTDPKQWEVLDRAFTGHATMVLIGDPKQAIYAFRGGDVVTYLAAAETATTRATLGTNRRSDAALVERLQVVLRGAALGDPGIVVRPVTAAHPGTRLAGAPSPAPFRIRQVRRTGMRLVKGNVIQVDVAREHIAHDCAADIATLLASDATWDGAPIAAAHVAVLVGEWSQAELVRSALAARGIPAVVGGGTKLLTSPAGDEWLCLLEALEQPHRAGRVRAAALTSFLGLTLAELDRGGEALTDEIADRLRGWALLAARAWRRRSLRGDRGARTDGPRPRHRRRRAAADRPASRRARRCTRPPSGRRSGRPGCWSGCGPSARSARRSASAASTATLPRCRSPPSTRARACSTPSSTSPSWR